MAFLSTFKSGSSVSVIFTTSGCKSRDLMASASPNRVAEEVYPTL